MTIYEFIKARVTEISAVNYFEFGSFKYIQGRLSDYAKNNTYSNKFPAVFMITDPQQKQHAVKSTYPLHLIIVNLTKRNYTTQQRLDNNFTTILNPIYDELISILSRYYTNDGNTITHTKTDHFFWSSEPAKDQNKLAERLDAIEITDLDFEIDLNKCYI